MRLRRDSLARSRRRALERVAPGPLGDALVVPPPDADVVTDRLPPVSYTHLTLPTN